MREIHRRSLRRISPRPDGSGSALSCARLSSRPDADACGAGGWALYRYDSLFRSARPELADAERAALAALTTA